MDKKILVYPYNRIRLSNTRGSINNTHSFPTDTVIDSTTMQGTLVSILVPEKEISTYCRAAKPVKTTTELSHVATAGAPHFRAGAPQEKATATEAQATAREWP